MVLQTLFKEVAKKSSDTAYVKAMKNLAKEQNKLSRQDRIKRLIEAKNIKGHKGTKLDIDDPVLVGDVSKGKTTHFIPLRDADVKIGIGEGKGHKGADVPYISYRFPFEKTERGRRDFINSQLDDLEKGIVGHYKKNKEKFGFKTNAEAEDWARQRLLFTPMSTMQRWVRKQFGPVAEREFGYPIHPSGIKVADPSGYGKTGLSDILIKKFGRRTPVGAGPKYKPFNIRRQERDLENFLRQPTGKKGEINADVIATDEIIRMNKFPDLKRKRINEFRQEKGLKGKISDRSLLENMFGLTRHQASAYSKIDPQLQGIFSMGKGKGPLGPKLQDMIRKYVDPSKFSSEYAKNQAMLHRLHDRMIQYNPGVPPKAVSLLQRNNMHKSAEFRLRALDDRIKSKLGSKKEIKEWKTEMKEIGEDMELLGLQSDINGVVYGKWYANPGDSTYKQLLPFFRSLKKEHPLKRLSMKGPTGKKEKYKHKGFDEGGIVDGYAAGGIIKSLLPKMSRRKFLKGAAATAASAALPRSALKSTVPTVKSLMERRLSFAPPWVAKMTSALNLAVNKKGITKLPNGTTVEYIKGPHTKYDSHKLAVKTADGNEDLVNFKETKDSLEIEFDIRDEWHNNQHIYIDKKKKTAELIDENYYMTSPEDYAKDDPIIWDIDKKSLDKTIVLDKTTKADDYIYDYMSTPNDSDYSYLFERYIDSFSPAGNIFKTKEYAKQLRKKEALDKRVQEDRSMAEWEEQFRGGHGMHAYKDGGLAKADFVTEGIDLIKANPQRFVAGGLVKKYAPNVLGKLTNYRPKLTGKGPDLSGVRADLYTPPKGPYTITDESGVRILDKSFKDLTEAQKALNDLATLRTQDASTFKIFGKRPPKTAEGVSEPAPEVNLGMLGKELPPEKPGAMFWGSREKIIHAPYDIMTGKQWLRFLKGFDEEQVFAGAKKAESVLGALRSEGKVLSKDFGDKMKLYRGDKNHPEVVAALKAHKAHQIKVKKANDELARLKLSEREGAGKEFHERILTLRRAQEQFPPIKDMELNDTGLAPYLSQNPNKMISKEQLVKDFDTKLAPEIEVVSLGKEGAGREVDQLYNKMNKMDMDIYRDGPIKNVLTGVRNRVHPLREAVGNNNKDAIMEIVDSIDNLTFDNFGVSNAIKEGFPQKFPYELKNILQRIAQISGVRTAGFKKYTKDVQYRGQQTLGGGENYREFLFKYKHPSGSLRETEPMKQYSDLGADHFSSLRSKDQTGGFVHSRVSDRTDEFGRRILHIEEIQSDLHQPVNAAARRVRKAEAEGKRPSASDIKKSKYAPRGDMIKESIDEANEQQLVLILSKIEDLASKPITKRTQVRLNRLNKERAKIRKIIKDKRAKMATGDHSGVAMGPLSKTEDYNEFVMKYMTKVAQEGGYDGVTISSGAIKNRGEAAGSLDWKGNMVAYGPIAEGAMKKVAKKTGAKYLKTSIIDDKGRGWEVPMIWLDDTAVKFNVQKGMPIYRKGGMVING